MAREEAEIKELSKKLAQNPDSMVFVQLADAHRRAGDLEQSVKVCQLGLERHPTYATARAILGRNFLDLGRLDDADAEFRKIEVADPENIMAHRMLGQIAMQKGQYAEAINRQQRVLSLDPEDATAQELLQEALRKSKEAPTGNSKEPAPRPEAPAPREAPKAASSSDQSGTIKVAEIYIKKGALDEAAEVLQEVLASDPDNAQARQKLQEVNERRGQKGAASAPTANAIQEAKEKLEAEARKRADEEAKIQAEAAARQKAEEEKAKAEAEARKKAEEAKAKAEAEARQKAEEEAKAKAEAEARKKAEEEKAKAEAEARQKAEEEAKAKSDAEARKKAEQEAQAKAEAEARQKAEDMAKAQAAEEARARAKADAEARTKADAEARQREQEEKDRKASKLSSDDILSVMTSSSDDLISDPSAPAEKAAPAPAKAAGAMSPEARVAIDEFLRAQAMEASLLMDGKGVVIESKLSGDAAAMGATAGAIFSNTEKAAQRMAFGGLKQIMIMGEDTRQILFVALKSGVLVALTGRNTNLGLLRVAVNDLVKRA
jgi:predicted regulator of Ras-like GTPase activity (Roadblock/LC7/MglB family)/Flp pilus assembly protein TadD